MLYRLIYCSETAEPLSPDSVQNLLEVARRRNRLRNITGVLAFDSRSFLQAIEGDRVHLSDLYGKLVQDSRHHSLLLLGCEPIARRNFSDWAMGFAAAHANHRRLYLRHGPSASFEPRRLSAAGALALLMDLTREEPAEADAWPEAEPVATA